MIKLAWHSLRVPDKKEEWIKIIGKKVCPCNGSSPVGIIVDIGKSLDEHYYRTREVTVLWATGKKRGKREVKSSHLLTDFDAFFAAHKKEFDALQASMDEAATVGL